jgi:hypothetical protein
MPSGSQTKNVQTRFSLMDELHGMIIHYLIFLFIIHLIGGLT